MDRCFASGQELAKRFIAEYGRVYTEAITTNSFAPAYAFGVATLAAGLPLEQWFFKTGCILKEELRVGEIGGYF